MPPYPISPHQLPEHPAAVLASLVTVEHQFSRHWQEFAASAEEVMSQCALHRLAEKLGLESNVQ